MKQLSFLEKLGILGQNILAHPFFICILLIPVALIFLNKKITKKAIVLIYISILAIILFIGNTTIFALFDNVVDGLFMALYFPNFVTLFIVEVASAIITLVTFIKPNITKSKKIINIVSFAIIQTLFCLIVTVVQVNEINIYEENALYGNDDVLTLMQLFMGMFFLQIVSLLVIYAIDKVTARLDAKENGEPQKENHITHVKIVPKEKIIIKEPEVTLPKAKPVKPLNKKYIDSSHIKPISLDEIINKEKQEKPKPAPTIPTVQAEALYIPKKETTPPTTVEIKKETPLLQPEILATPKIETLEVLDTNEKTTVKDINLPASQDTKTPPPTTPKQAKWIPKPRPNLPTQRKSETQQNTFTFKEFEPEFPDTETKTTSMSPIVKEDAVFPVMTKIEETKPIKKIPVPKAKPKQFINYDVINKKENLSTPPQVELSKVMTKPLKPDGLIENLVIINFEKTISAVKNLNTVYTM